MRLSRIGISFLLVAIVAVGLALPAAAAEGSEGEVHETGAQAPVENDEILEKGEVWEVNPDGRTKRTYRDKINLITRKPLRKTESDRVYVVDSETGRYATRNIVARKRTSTRLTREGKSRWEHVLAVARGPITRPPE